MAYHDDLEGKDKQSTTDGLHMYTTGPGEQHVTETDQTEDTKERTVEGKQTRTPKPGLLERARRAMFGEKTTGEKARAGWLAFKADGGFAKFMTAAAKPKSLAALVMAVFMGVFGVMSMFSSYKNEDVIRNDDPIQCEPGNLELPAAGEATDVDIQEVVNILYDIFVNQFGYSPEALTGMVACMLVETGCNPDRLESDYLPAMQGAKEAFDAVAGPGTSPTSDVAQQAYWAYGELFKTSGGWNGNSFYMSDGGRMCPGIGLIQWTAGRANNFIMGLDKVSLDVSPMDVHYQAAYLIAEAQTSYQACAPGSAFASVTDVREATRIFFGNMVYGNPSVQYGNGELEKRLARLNAAEGTPGAIELVASAQANSEFTMDAVTMAEQLAEDTFTKSVTNAQFVQLCVNNTFISTADIANAAVSISFLERGDYEDVQGAYGMYRRAARSPNMINDWDYIEGKNGNINSLGQPYNGSPTYASARGVPSDEPKAGWRFYDIDGAPGKLDLIACTEYYYFAHLIAFPKETGTSNAGYFSSCDRGTATAIRIAGADDKFPAGNPLYQLMWACGGAKQGAKHNENARGTQGAGFLWKFSGFMRGSDWYSASGSPSISPGTVMISWSDRAANGLLNEGGGGGATGSGMLGEDTDAPNTGESDSSAADPSTDPMNPDLSEYMQKDQRIRWSCLRWPTSVGNSTHHIVTYVGDATVQNFWGLEWLQQQWDLFDDADRLIRKDLTETIPDIMKAGLSFKSSYGNKTADQKMTFYKADAMAAKKSDDTKKLEPANDRQYEFNPKTGLPTFKAWEQIFVRLIHNSDDDAAAREAEEFELYEEVKPFQEDGYLDDYEEEEIDSLIEQYDNEKTYQNKHFFRDWNSLGAKGTGDDTSGHEKDYQNVPISSLIWYDSTNGFADEPWTHQYGAVSSPAWRYELVTDIEYRQNQFLRFGLASLMCSYPSEEDADVLQAGTESGKTEHIIGNVYRRYSRIPDEMDTSGRYYYYNTVVSNDMLQDLVQLYTQEKNSWGDGTSYIGNGGKTERNFGPMYTLALGRVYDASYSATSRSASWVDRRYGLTEFDIDYIQNKGIEGNKMGEADGDAIDKALSHILTEPMHMFSTYQLALYDNTKQASADKDPNGAHEPQHLYNDINDPEIQPYETEIYGMNPFLMLEGKKLLNAVAEMDTGTNWEAGSKSGKSVRNSVDDGGVDVNNTGEQDDRLSWIDRHYFVTKNGAIGTFAYQVLALQPSTGTKMTQANYANELRGVQTLDAGHEGQTDTNNLLGSKGLVQYSDFIYAENETDNAQMAKRLFGHDDRNGDGDRDDYNRRDFILLPYYHTHAQQCDHSQLRNYTHYDLHCRWQNNTVNPGPADNLTVSSQAMIDTQVALNGQDGTQYQGSRRPGDYSCGHLYDDANDYGDTISFNTKHVKNRGKYDLSQVLADKEGQEIRYFADTGDEIGWNDKPIIHVTCNGWTQSNPCKANESCRCICYKPAVPPSGIPGTPGYDPGSDEVLCECVPGVDNCTNTRCHACGEEIKCGETHVHPCSKCLVNDWCHDHRECDDAAHVSAGADPSPTCTCWPTTMDQSSDDKDAHHCDGGRVDNGIQSDKCHYEYGCNALEYLYHNTDGADGPRRHTSSITGRTFDVNSLYMAIPVTPGVDMHDFDITDYIRSGSIGTPNSVVPDKCNLVQQVTYNDADGWVDNNWQKLIDQTQPGSLRYPDTNGGSYMSSVHSMIASLEKHASQIKIGHPGRSDDSYTEGDSFNPAYGTDVIWQPGQNKGLLQYFTIEGDSIHREENWQGYLQKVLATYGKAESEYFANIKYNGTQDDLRALDPIRNRVGYGKSVNQKISSSLTQAVSQTGSVAYGSSTKPIRYENGYLSTEQSDAADLQIESHGWGEVAVTGTQHPKGPMDAATPYGNCDPRYPNGDSSVAGPDGSKGNNLLAFGPSLIREILGDEHVVHTKFDVQSYEGLTEQDAGDNGRDFKFYVDKKQAAAEITTKPEYAFIKNRIAGELGKSPDELTMAEVEANLKAKDYQTSDSKYYQDHEEDFKKDEGAGSGVNKYGLFKKMDMDTLYLNYYTGELTDKMYAEQAFPHEATDKKENEWGTPNMKNPLANACESAPDGAVNGGDAMMKLQTYKEQGLVPEADGMGQENTGDYRNWVTHASRGHRGMMTQYLNFANFFKDVYKKGDASEQDKTNAYMLFEVVNRTDVRLDEDGGKDEYGHPMGSDDADGANAGKYGGRNQDRTPTSKDESFVYVKPPSDAIRQIGSGVTGNKDSSVSWGYGDSAGFSDTYGQGSNSHWKNMIDLYNAAMSVTREYGY